MLRCKKSLLTLALLTFSSASNAEIGLSIASGLKAVNVEEVSVNDKRLNQETGDLPYLSLGFDFPFESGFTVFTKHDIAAGDLNYDGQLQNGNPYQTYTETRLWQNSLGLTSPPIFHLLNGKQHLVGLFSIHNWDRNILGSQQVNSLHEQYDWKSLGLGFKHVNDNETLKLGATFQKNFDGHMSINIPNVATGNLNLPQGDGLIVTAEYQLMKLEKAMLNIGLNYSYQQTIRSDVGNLYNSGQFVGTAAMPKHSLQQTTLYLGISF